MIGFTQPGMLTVKRQQNIKNKRPNGRYFLVEAQGLTRHKCLRANRNDFAALRLQNLLVFEPATALHGVSSDLCHKKINDQTVVIFWWRHRDSNPGPND